MRNVLPLPKFKDMLTIWKQTNKLIEIDEFEKDCWINVTNPTPEEIDRLVNELRIPVDYINDILDVDERSRTEGEGRWLMIIVRIPVFRTDNSIPYVTVPLGILISPQTIVTICLYENDVIRSILFPVKTKVIKIENKVNFVLEIFNRSTILYLHYLKDINVRTNLIERKIERSTENKELQNLMRMEKCLVFFITSLKSNELLIQKLQRSRFASSPDLNEDLLADVIIEIKQAIEMSQIYSDIQAGLMDAFASVISNNLNDVMKQLTVITIILMIPTLIASYFGMNLNNHFENSNSAFFFVVIGSILIALIGALIFRKRNFF
jgi:magnesium transporter